MSLCPGSYQMLLGTFTASDSRRLCRQNVRFGSKADICSAKRHVRFTPESGHSQCNSVCPLCAMCGRLRVGKNFLYVCSIGRCSHVFGLLVRHTGPLAIMPSADQVPIRSTHSTMRWHKWVVLIAGSTGSALRAVRPPNLHITPDVRRDLVYAASATGSL